MRVKVIQSWNLELSHFYKLAIQRAFHGTSVLKIHMATLQLVVPSRINIMTQHCKNAAVISYITVATLPTCSDISAVSCSARDFALQCLTLNLGGICTPACPDYSYNYGDFCFRKVIGMALLIVEELTFQLHSNYHFEMSIVPPITPNQYLSLISSLSLVITGPGSPYHYTAEITSQKYTNIGKIEGLEVSFRVFQNIFVDENARLKIQISLASDYFQTQEVILNPQLTPQYQAQLQKIENAVQVVMGTTQGTIGAVIVQALILDLVLKYLWSMTNTAQMIYYFGLIKVPLPQNIGLVFRYLSLANGDFKLLEELPNPFQKIENKMDEEPLNARFQEGGFEASSFFLILEVKIVLFLYYLGWVVIAVIIASILKCCSCQCAKITRQRCQKFFNWDFWLRLILELYLELVVVSLISITQPFNSEFFKLDSYLAIGTLCALLFFALFCTFYLLKKRRKLVAISDQWKGRTLTQELNLTHKASCRIMWYPFFMWIRLLYAYCIVILRTKPLYVISTCLGLFFLNGLYCLLFRPFKDRLQNIIQIFDNACLASLMAMMLYLYQQGYGLTDSYAMKLGYIMIAIVVLYFLVNIVVVLSVSGIQTVQRCKECRRRKQQKKKKKVTDESSVMDFNTTMGQLSWGRSEASEVDTVKHTVIGKRSVKYKTFVKGERFKKK